MEIRSCKPDLSSYLFTICRHAVQCCTFCSGSWRSRRWVPPLFFRFITCCSHVAHIYHVLHVLLTLITCDSHVVDIYPRSSRVVCMIQLWNNMLNSAWTRFATCWCMNNELACVSWLHKAHSGQEVVSWHWVDKTAKQLEEEYVCVFALYPPLSPNSSSAVLRELKETIKA